MKLRLPRRRRPSVPTDVLSTRPPLPRRPRPDAEVALYALAGSPVAPDDDVLVAESGAIVHHHFLGGRPC
ncbi:hypothetical protein UQW22_10030 [Isoptericola halotolerans]|uniref:hypothetical protein n=1 Tax=Isoptericola halotolerans TaxID=300560 RepID=UPI00388F262B